MSDRPSTAGYAEEADTLAKAYESLAFADVHRKVLHLIPASPCRVLDIGAVTGRDAAGLARLGHAVTAIEPTAELRAHGLRLHADVAIEWIDDGLPELAQVRGRQFDVVLLTAVWMHLDEDERRIAMSAVADLIAPNGLMTMTLRHGPVPEGRRMFDVSGAETSALATRHGLATLLDLTGADEQRRAGVTWTRLAFRRPSPT